MLIYALRYEHSKGRESRTFGFPSDDEAIKYALGSASGSKVEVWRGKKMIASVDERPWRERRATPRSAVETSQVASPRAITG
jgi:hypothetical protein